MPSKKRFVIAAVVIIILVLTFDILILTTVKVPLTPKEDPLYKLRFGPNPFALAGATTESGYLIKDEFYPDDDRCSDCHSAVVMEYQNTQHALAGKHPKWEFKEYYFAREFGANKIRLCAGCHLPGALIRGEIKNSSWWPGIWRKGKKNTEVTCVSCHAITEIGEVNRVGIRAYTIDIGNLEHPLFYFSDNPAARWVSNFFIYLNPRPHKNNYMKPFYKSSYYCGTCHARYGAGNFTPNTYEEWNESSYNTGDPSTALTCQDCHMTDNCTKRVLTPGRTTTFTFSKKNVTSHIMPGSNTMLPYLSADRDLFDLEEQCLKDAASLEISVPEVVERGETLFIDVIVSNIGAGHDLPTSPSKQLWLDVKVTDGIGNSIFRSGGMSQKGYVDPEAVSFGYFRFDKEGEPLKELSGYPAPIVVDNRIHAKESRVIGYDIDLPIDARGPFKVEAKLRYRYQTQNIINLLLVEHSRDIEANFDYYVSGLPITDLAVDEVTIEVK